MQALRHEFALNFIEKAKPCCFDAEPAVLMKYSNFQQKNDFEKESRINEDGCDFNNS